MTPTELIQKGIERKISFSLGYRELKALTVLVGQDKTTVDELVSEAVRLHIEAMAEKAGLALTQHIRALMKGESSKQVNSHKAEGELVNVSLNLTANQWRAFELVCAELGCSHPAFVKDSVISYLDRN